MTAARLVLAALLGLVVLAGCTLEGRPRVDLETPSPDGTITAFVKNHYTIDGPDQSIWLRFGDGSKKKLQRLAADQDWCSLIVWSGDSSRVGFLIQDAHLFAYDSGTGDLVADEWLVEQDGYPPTYRVRNLALSEEGRRVSFRRCRRRGGDCSDQTLDLN